MDVRLAAGPDGTAPPDTARRCFLQEVAALLALGCIGTAEAQAPAACLLTPEATEGPFYLDDALMRADIRDGRPGQPLRLRLRVVEARRGCAPVQGALVSVWHCDANGSYSGESATNRQTRYLRGVQATGADGVATFTTIYPGWYPSRAIHIHFKVLLAQSEVLTSQLYFDDALSRQVLRSHPAYGAHGVPTRPTTGDPIAGSRPSTVRVNQPGDTGSALEGEFTVGIARA
ncbi:intradiol ring-cleavage dioxygenase [Cupriavidus sp. amp6]|uniref:intradiol ring-cleavage dioxygenase n=1 Tax=Cupriavidus sp. amp6 TaxID=388051 RepID=UPI00042071AB|nr:intradiol ring-cleavage dioxygenase [Cupriavidus sp. amp6]